MLTTASLNDIVRLCAVVLDLNADITQVKTLDHKPPMTEMLLHSLVNSLKLAVAEGIHPKMITKGASGSYFARAKGENGRVTTVACVLIHILLCSLVEFDAECSNRRMRNPMAVSIRR